LATHSLIRLSSLSHFASSLIPILCGERPQIVFKALVKRAEPRLNVEKFIGRKPHVFIVREDGPDAPGVDADLSGEAIPPVVLGVIPLPWAAKGDQHGTDAIKRGRHCRALGRL
jgi:hypothetical protein